jgi:ABC-type glutathione transport system ATPase component
MSNLDPSYTIGHQLTEPLRRVHGMSAADAKARAREVLLRWAGGPDRVLRSYPHQVSGGMAQRVLIAGAISGRPSILIADEPTTALDVTVQAEVLGRRASLQQEYGMALLIVTHNFGVVADICDRVIVMRGGEIVEQGDVDPLFAHPQQPYTRERPSLPLDEAAGRAGAGRRRARRHDEHDGGARMTALLEVQDLVVEYGRGRSAFRALHGVSIDRRARGVHGPRRRIRIRQVHAWRIPASAPVTGGSIRFDGRDIVPRPCGASALAADVQVVFQDPYGSLNPAMTIGDILSEPLLTSGLGGSEAQARVREMLDRVRLPETAMDRYPSEFSGGSASASPSPGSRAPPA